MVAVERSNRFKHAYKKLTPAQQAAVDRTLTRFMENPRHPSLHFEKIGKYRSIRVDLGVRIILQGQGSAFTLLDVGSHDLQDLYARGHRP